MRTSSNWLAAMLAMAAVGMAAHAAAVPTAYVDDSWISVPAGSDPDGAGPATAMGVDAFFQILPAITAVDAGGVVQVAAGSYTAGASSNLPITITKSFTLRGPQAGVDPRPAVNSARVPGGPEEATLDGLNAIASVIAIGDVDGTFRPADVVIEGFTLRGATGDVVQSPAVTSAPLTGIVLQHNIIGGPATSGDDGVQLRATDGAYIAYNYVYGTLDDEINVCCGSSNAVIEFNECVGGTANGLNGSGGIYVYGPGIAATPEVLGHAIRNNIVDGTGGFSRGSAINYGGISGDNARTGGPVENNILRNTRGPGVRVFASNVTITGNTIYRCATEPVSGALSAVYIDATAANQVTNVAITGNTMFLNGSAQANSGAFWVRSGVNAASLATISFTGNKLYSNRNGVINSSTGGGNLDATGNFWGDAAGPSDLASEAGTSTDPCTSVAAAGLGDTVSSRVCFSTGLDPVDPRPAVVYVDDTGSDFNDGSLAAPFATVETGAARVASGGIVEVAEGQYTHSSVISQSVSINGPVTGAAGFAVTDDNVAFTVDSDAPITVEMTHLDAFQDFGSGGTGLHVDSLGAGGNVTFRFGSFDGFAEGAVIEGAGTATLSGNAFTWNGVAVTLARTAPVTEAVVTENRFRGNGTGVVVSPAESALVVRNSFLSSAQEHILAPEDAGIMFASLAISNNAFFTENIFNAAGTGSVPAVGENWYPSIFGRDLSDAIPGDGIANGETKGLGTAGSAQDPTDLEPVAQLDRDADGYPDAFELDGGALNDYDSNDNAVPDGAEALLGEGPGTFLLAADADGDGFVDWYEAAYLAAADDAMSMPALGDVTADGTVELGDAVRALQIINGSLPDTPSATNNPNGINVVGSPNFTTLNNPLQILRYQNGSRTALPALPGIS